MDELGLGVVSPSVLLDVARRTGRLQAVALEVRDMPVPAGYVDFPTPAELTAQRNA